MKLNISLWRGHIYGVSFKLQVITLSNFLQLYSCTSFFQSADEMASLRCDKIRLPVSSNRPVLRVSPVQLHQVLNCQTKWG